MVFDCIWNIAKWSNSRIFVVWYSWNRLWYRGSIGPDEQNRETDYEKKDGRGKGRHIENQQTSSSESSKSAGLPSNYKGLFILRLREEPSSPT